MGKPLALLFDPFESLVCSRVYLFFMPLHVFILRLQVLYISGTRKLLVLKVFRMILFGVVQTMTHVVGDGKSNWLEGAILICEWDQSPTFDHTERMDMQVYTS